MPVTSFGAPPSTPTANSGCGRSLATRADHPFRRPYRAQFVAAWMFRELGYDMVEHCARVKGGETRLSGLMASGAGTSA